VFPAIHQPIKTQPNISDSAAPAAKNNNPTTIKAINFANTVKSCKFQFNKIKLP